MYPDQTALLENQVSKVSETPDCITTTVQQVLAVKKESY